MKVLLAVLLLGALAPAPASPAAEEISAEEAKRRWLERLDGRHFTARVRMLFERGEDREERLIEVWRDDASGGGERLLARFHAPLDLRGVGLLYLENEGRPNDYFLYQPGLRRVRRIPESLASEDVYGIDLEYLGFGVAQIEPTELEGLERVSLDGEPMFRLRESATRSNPRFDERVIWLDPESFVPMRTEHRRGDRTSLLATTVEVELVQGVPTPSRIVFERPDDHEKVTMLLESIDYESPIPRLSSPCWRS